MDCSRQAAKKRRSPVEMPLASLSGPQGKIREYPVTATLIALCVAIYVIQTVYPPLLTRWAFIPLFAESQPWRFLTSAFLHSGLMHLAFNMWALWVIGTSLERALGAVRYTAVYFLSALGGSLAVYVLASPNSTSWLTATVGASGAIFGLFGMLFILQYRMGRDTSTIVLLIGINLAISFLGAAISWQAHLGGLMTGSIFGALFAWAPPTKRKQRTTIGVIALAIIFALLGTMRAMIM